MLRQCREKEKVGNDRLSEIGAAACARCPPPPYPLRPSAFSAVHFVSWQNRAFPEVQCRDHAPWWTVPTLRVIASRIPHRLTYDLRADSALRRVSSLSAPPALICIKKSISG
jgi:hypothetical protein